MNTTSSHYLSIHHNICSTVLAPTILRYITIWSLGSSVQRAGDRVSTGPLGISHRALSLSPLSLSPLSLPSLLRRLRPGPGPEISRAGGPLPSQNAKTAAAEAAAAGGGAEGRGAVHWSVVPPSWRRRCVSITGGGDAAKETAEHAQWRRNGRRRRKKRRFREGDSATGTLQSAGGRICTPSARNAVSLYRLAFDSCRHVTVIP